MHVIPLCDCRVHGLGSVELQNISHIVHTKFMKVLFRRCSHKNQISNITLAQSTV